MTQRIVIVDDVALNRRVFESLLAELSSVELLSFANSAELLKQLSSIDASLFIVDYHMPAPDGLAVLSAIRNDERVQKTPVVIVTAAEEREVCYAALDLGASDFFVRPIEPREFIRRMGNLLQLEASRREIETRRAQERHAAEQELLTAERATRKVERELVASKRALERINRTLRTLSAANAALVRTESESELLQAMCHVVVEVGRYAMAWIGFAEHDDAKSVRPVAWAGSGTDYVRVAQISWAAGDRGRGPTGSAIRDRKPVINRDFETNPIMKPWLDAAAQRGFRSSIAVPLTDKSGTFGAITLYATEPDAFDEEEATLLIELGSDLSFGLRALRDRAARQASDVRLHDVMQRHGTRLETLLRIANTPSLRGSELMQAMLEQAATAIRPPQRFCGLLSRVEASDVVVIGVWQDPSDDDPRTALLSPGSRAPVDNSFLPRTSRTQAWDDVAKLPDVPESIATLGWRAIISTQFETRVSTYSLALASREPTSMAFDAEDFAYLELLASSFANELEVNQLEDSLRDEEARSRQHAERLVALWRLVNDPSLHDEELWATMLSQAAADLRPGQVYQGNLWRVQGANMVLEAVTNAPHRLGSNVRTVVGSKIPLAESVVGKLLAEGMGTRSWDDIQGTAYSGTLARATGIRTFIITTFVAGGATWGLSFASTEMTSKPLGPQAHAYIEVLAAFFANHVQQRWQFNRIQYHQSHDVLTGLLNRSQFRSQARTASIGSARYAIILIDLNAFHEINTSYGSIIGDALLVEVGNALKQRAAESDIVGRVGGDVFGIYLANPISTEFVRARALDFAQAFARAFSTGDREGKEFIGLTGSLAVAVAPDAGRSLDKILSHADAALVIAKERGPGSVVFYEPGMEADAHARATFRNELAAAVSDNQFTLYYQPHIEIATGAVSGCEALIRWHHPTRGLLLPGQFIPFAEQTGFITNIDAWVMANALAAAKELSVLRPGFRLYFNLSGRQAGDPKVIRAFIRAARDGIDLRNIGVEITETDVMRDVDATRRVCRALRRLGVRIAIDDFGTGYSSLASLKQLPVDIVKIDRSFISGVLTDPNDEAIAETIISITKRFGFESLGEGAEQPGELEWLRQRGCRYVQGYVVCHPLPMVAFKSWLAAGVG